MNNGIGLILLIWFCFQANSQPGFPPPPGTKKISNNTFLDKRPVSYSDYYEFYYYTKFKHPDHLKNVTPLDTTITYRNEVLWNNPKFNDFPVLDLDIDQISMYCKWRSSAVNTLINNPNLRCSNKKYWEKFDKLDPDKKYDVVYSLASNYRIKNYCKIAKTNAFDEILIDGICFAKKSSRLKAFNRSNLTAFRCMAEYR